MKTVLLSAALIGLSTAGALACDYGNTSASVDAGNTSASVDAKMTVASIDTARQNLPTTQEATKEDAKTVATQPSAKKDDRK